MQKRAAALILCVLLVFQLSAVPARSTEYICFTAAGENILPLSDKTMPFWHQGYLYIPSSIFTGNVRVSLNVVSVTNSSEKRVILYSGGKSLWFEWEKDYAYDQDTGTKYQPGAVYRNGEAFVPASVVARFFDLQYTVTPVSTQSGGKSVSGDLVWLRKPGFVLTDSVFANAASPQIANRYADYLKAKTESGSDAGSAGGIEIEGKRLYLCLTVDDSTPSLLNILDAYHSQAAFFCTPEFMQAHGDLLRRMTATGQAIGILVNAASADLSVAEQLSAGNQALNQATCGQTRLVYIQNSSDEILQEVQAAGYCPLIPDLDRSDYSLHNASSASALLRRASGRWGDVSIWLADTVTYSGMQAFLSAANSGDGRCLAWTETSL